MTRAREFAIAKQAQMALESQLRDVSAFLSTFPKSAMGLTPDSVKATPEWSAAKRDMDILFANLRAFNAVFCKRFARELRDERDARYSQTITPRSLALTHRKVA